MNINKLLAFVKSIEDFRLNRKKLHPAENIVFIAILALYYVMQPIGKILPTLQNIENTIFPNI